jgi:hypothetical protein
VQLKAAIKRRMAIAQRISTSKRCTNGLLQRSASWAVVADG